MPVRRGITTVNVPDLGPNGLVVGREVASVGMMPYNLNSTTKTANATLTNADAGITLVSGTASALTVTMPAAPAAPGSLFIIRSLSAHAHVITGSTSDAGVLFVERGMMAGPLVTNFSGSQGQRLTMPATANASVVMMSDGVRWCVFGGSGSLTYTAP